MRHGVHGVQVVMRALLPLLVLLAPALAAAEPQVSPILFINRCKGGCVVRGGIDDARAMSSSIPCPGGATCGGGGCNCQSAPTGDYNIEEFRSGDNTIGADGKCRGGTAIGALCNETNGPTVCTGGGACYSADDEWKDIMQCIRELYSPYNIEVTDTVPPGGLSHNQGILAGKPSQIGFSGIGGISPGTQCAPRDNVISFSFANSYGGSGISRVWGLCGVVAQETAHAYGLDHAFKRSDGGSACWDPMTYLPDCGQKFFRNDNTTCGEFSTRPCDCGGFQNSHLKLVAIFGEGTPITSPPTITLTGPAPNATLTGPITVTARAGAQRGISRLDMWINGYLWATGKGVPFGNNGQPEANYALLVPTAVPNSILDIVVKAYDDINVETVAPMLTVTKGSACSDASVCAKGQKCEDGRCFWAEPTGQLGDACEYPQFCVSESCVETTEGSVCASDCVVGVADSCPMEFYCEGEAGTTGFCLAKVEDPGCCSVGGDRRAAAMLSVMVLGLLLRRRRPRRAARPLRGIPSA